MTKTKVVYLLLAIGIGVELAALSIGVALGAIDADYFANAKGVRDAATTGSSVLTQLGQVEAVHAWLVPFQFVGVAVLFAAIGLALSGIIERIQLRGQAMANGLRTLLRPE